jgi:hypothetical protein
MGGAVLPVEKLDLHRLTNRDLKDRIESIERGNWPGQRVIFAVDGGTGHAYTGRTLTVRRSRGGDAMEDPSRVDTGLDESGDYDVGLDDGDGMTPQE